MKVHFLLLISGISHIILIGRLAVNKIDIKKGRTDPDFVETAEQKSNQLQHDLQSLATIVT